MFPPQSQASPAAVGKSGGTTGSAGSSHLQPPLLGGLEPWRAVWERDCPWVWLCWVWRCWCEDMSLSTGLLEEAFAGFCLWVSLPVHTQTTMRPSVFQYVSQFLLCCTWGCVSVHLESAEFVCLCLWWGLGLGVLGYMYEVCVCVCVCVYVLACVCGMSHDCVCVCVCVCVRVCTVCWCPGVLCL